MDLNLILFIFQHIHQFSMWETTCLLTEMAYHFNFSALMHRTILAQGVESAYNLSLNRTTCEWHAFCKIGFQKKWAVFGSLTQDCTHISVLGLN